MARFLSEEFLTSQLPPPRKLWKELQRFDDLPVDDFRGLPCVVFHYTDTGCGSAWVPCEVVRSEGGRCVVRLDDGTEKSVLPNRFRSLNHSEERLNYCKHRLLDSIKAQHIKNLFLACMHVSRVEARACIVEALRSGDLEYLGSRVSSDMILELLLPDLTEAARRWHLRMPDDAGIVPPGTVRARTHEDHLLVHASLLRLCVQVANLVSESSQPELVRTKFVAALGAIEPVVVFGSEPPAEGTVTCRTQKKIRYVLQYQFGLDPSGFTTVQ